MSSSNVTWHAGQVIRSDRGGALLAQGATVWLTGLSGSGKSTLAAAIEQQLVLAGHASYRLDGDNLRTGLNGDLGFSREARDENCRRVAEVARLFADAGLVAVVAVISPYAESRLRARQLHEQSGLPFVEVYLAASAECCATRDPKGLYAQASAGQIGPFTGVDDPYEVPESPDVFIDAGVAVADAVKLVLDDLKSRMEALPAQGAPGARR
jgi:bifunctional enzyme CysN/CysC